MRWMIAALVSALTMASAQAQVMGPNGQSLPGSSIGQHVSNAATDKSEDQKPKANDKAYDAALHNLPNKQYDPWHGVR